MAEDGVITYSNFQISPPKRRAPEACSRDDDLSRPQFLILGAFTRTPKIHFERLPVGNSRTRTLVVRNPSPHDIWFRFVKMPSPVFQMSCGDTSIIPAENQLTITIKWSPTEVGQVFEPLRCQSGLSGVTLTVHLLGDAEPSNVWKTKSSRARSSSTGSSRRPVKDSLPKIEPSLTEKPFSLANTLQLNLDEPVTTAATLSPSRRETYLVPPTPHTIALRMAPSGSEISGITLNFDDDLSDDFKENDCLPSLPLPVHQKFQDFELSLDEPIGTDEFGNELSQQNSLSSIPSDHGYGYGNEERGNYTRGVNVDMNFRGAEVAPYTQVEKMESRISTTMKSESWEPSTRGEDLEGEFLDKAISQIDSLFEAWKMKRTL